MGEFRLDCSFCDEVIESESVDTVKDRGSSYLEDRHDTELLAVFTGMRDTDECRDCGATFATDGDDVKEFECPDCGVRQPPIVGSAVSVLANRSRLVATSPRFSKRESHHLELSPVWCS